MDRHYQDLTIVNRYFFNELLVIPRCCHIISIFFDDDAVRVHYVDDGHFKTTNIAYEQLKYRKLVID